MLSTFTSLSSLYFIIEYLSNFYQKAFWEMLYSYTARRVSSEACNMTQGQERRWHPSNEWIFGVVSAGLFLIVAGTIFITTPALFDETIAFFKDLTVVKVHDTSIYLPAPAFPRNHLMVYSAVMQFSLMWGIVEIAVLVLRFALHSTANKEAETLGNVAYWLGSYYLIQKFLIEETKWFEYWALIIILLGASLIVRAIFLAATRESSR